MTKLSPEAENKFSIIYADPPWKYNVWDKPTANGRTAESHYPTMTIDDLKAMPVNAIAAKNAALFMWCVSPSMPEAIELMRAWGFTYKTIAFCWVKETKTGKDHFGMGYYTRANVELCLLGIKGKPLPRHSRSIRQTQRHIIGRHSEKPAAFRTAITDLFGDQPRIELFARSIVAGWHCWGNEITGSEPLTGAIRG